MDVSINYDVKLPETYVRGKWQGLILQFAESGKPLAMVVISDLDKDYTGSALDRKLNNVTFAINKAARRMHRQHIRAFKRGPEIYICNEIVGQKEGISAHKVDYIGKGKKK